MPANSLERQRQELLSRVSASRVQTLESAERLCTSAQGGLAALRSSGRVLRGAGLAATGAMAAGALGFLLRKVWTHRGAALVAPVKGGGLFGPLLFQAVTMILIPYLRELVLKGNAAQHAQRQAQRPLIDLSRYKPSRVFFRWLGLEQ